MVLGDKNIWLPQIKISYNNDYQDLRAVILISITVSITCEIMKIIRDFASYLKLLSAKSHVFFEISQVI